jgi:hypothetical protein
VLTAYSLYYNEARTHLGLSKDAPLGRAVQRSGRITVTPVLSGSHHRYARNDFREGRPKRSPNVTKSLVEPIGRLVVAKKRKAKAKAKKSNKAKRAAVGRKKKGMTKPKPAKKAKAKKRAPEPTPVPLAPTPLVSE